MSLLSLFPRPPASLGAILFGSLENVGGDCGPLGLPPHLTRKGQKMDRRQFLLGINSVLASVAVPLPAFPAIQPAEEVLPYGMTAYQNAVYINVIKSLKAKGIWDKLENFCISPETYPGFVDLKTCPHFNKELNNEN